MYEKLILFFESYVCIIYVFYLAYTYELNYDFCYCYYY